MFIENAREIGRLHVFKPWIARPARGSTPDNIYLKPGFNDLCGFHEAEIEPAVKEIVRECGLDEDRGAEAVDQMRTWYNGYTIEELTVKTAFLTLLYNDILYVMDSE
ncbi:MAG: AAA family ATPase, partial [Desulfobacterales bacterium]|nr:AAA family ATPase [Desulfobacterales bacterium]